MTETTETTPTTIVAETQPTTRLPLHKRMAERVRNGYSALEQFVGDYDDGTWHREMAERMIAQTATKKDGINGRS